MPKKYAKHLIMRKEPVLHTHTYVVVVERRIPAGKKMTIHTKFHYAFNKADILAIKTGAKKGSRILVYRATHNYIEGWQV